MEVCKSLAINAVVESEEVGVWRVWTGYGEARVLIFMGVEEEPGLFEEDDVAPFNLPVGPIWTGAPRSERRILPGEETGELEADELPDKGEMGELEPDR